ncbi:carbamoyltransferase HypF [Hyperthermus butylicus]|uniref:Carbamoyltransferase n=1 Tax=Hyperthermus butylicus (strain DSM 5456 / JCM 9403 / PLM1-5) TaxID=415426 RepID=A2BKU6_HYPBU|nr:carbamoyltransferase HypF [Hyperthermus butylicus]ABM80607.1 hydrogenase maturation protein [Hyperthermus butylicus DSM 5456]
MANREALRVRVVGLVQGVGFRPFVHRLAERLGLAGYVRNMGGSEVEILVEGPPDSLRLFVSLLEKEKPPPAIIEEMRVEPVPARGLTVFRIEKSSRSRKERSMIPPDFGICDWCAREVLEPGTRFYRYPWTSCAWCGPRFSMMYDIPYDRENTAMREFPFCEECRRDYEDMGNIRRYHAQGFSCPRCGPKTILLDGRGEPLDVEDPVAEAARLIDEGHIVAVKGVGGFHIASLATDDEVVARVRRIKSRPTQPLALMARDCSVAAGLVALDAHACQLLRSPRRPILLLPKRDDAPVSPLVAPGLDTLGIMLPYTGLHLLLLHMVRDGFLVMTSGNRHGMPMCRTVECILDQLGGEIDYILTHNREIVHRVDDSVVRFTAGKPVLLRRARGYAPEWIRISRSVGEHVAVGADLQTAGAVSFDDKVVLTQYIGDLDEPGQLEELEEELKWLIRVYGLRPSSVALDMHPAYESRRLAAKLSEELDAEPVEVQHHHAHAVAAAADAGLDPWDYVPAVTVDGAGYGVDGVIWGGEAMIAGAEGFERTGTIKPFPLPGGDTATKRPLRILIGILSQGWGLDEILQLLEKMGHLGKGISEEEAVTSYKLARSNRTPLASSAGRLLDAVSALLGLRYRRTYEGEPAIVLEAYARRHGGKPLPDEPPATSYKGLSALDPLRVLEWVVEKLEEGVEPWHLAATVMYWVGRHLAETVLENYDGARDKPLLISGGAAVNDYIYMGAADAAKAYGRTVHIPGKVPPGDGGIALGQIIVAAAKTR